MPKAIRFIPSSWVAKPKRGRERQDDQLIASGAGGGPLGKPCHELGVFGGRQAKVDHGSKAAGIPRKQRLGVKPKSRK